MFNLIPVWELDGSRGLRALSAGQRWLLAALLLGLSLLAPHVFLLAILVVTALRAFGPSPERGDLSVLAQFGVLATSLAALAMLHPAR